MAMVGDLPHHAVDDELAVTVFRSRDERQRFDHECALFGGRVLAMFAEYGHGRIAGIAIEDREAKRLSKTRIPGGIFLQFAQIALAHDVSVISG